MIFDFEVLGLVPCGPDHQVRLIDVSGLLLYGGALEQLHPLLAALLDRLV